MHFNTHAGNINPHCGRSELATPGPAWQPLRMKKTLLLFFSLALLCACATEPVSRDVKIGGFRSKIKDPRQYWLTIRDSSRGFVVEGGHRLHPNQMVALPFLSGRSSEVPLINFRLLGEEFYEALVDTSAGESWAELDNAFLLNLIPLGPPEIVREPLHLRDAGRGVLSLAETLRFDQLYVENALIHTLTEIGPDSIGRGAAPHLVLGGEFLKQFRYFQINWPGRTVVLSATHPYKPDPDRLLAELPLRRLNGACVAEAVIDGRRQWTILDSAGAYDLAITGSPAAAVTQLTLGDLVFRHVRVTPHADLGLGWPNYPKIGTGLLSKFKVTVDNKLGRIFFEKP